MAARKLDLRTGRPVWLAYRAPAVPTAKLTRDISTDVLVVGMGISGALIAEVLTARGHEVVCIDRRAPLVGSTSATTALVQHEIDQPLMELSRSIGRAKADQAWRRSRLAIGNLKGRIEELAIACNLAERPSLYLAGNMLGPGDLREEAEHRNRAGLGATYLTKSELSARFGIDRDGGVLSHSNLALDPRKFAAGMLLRAAERKARFYAPVEAVDFNSTRDGVSVATKAGPAINARHVVLATGYELTDMVPMDGHRVISTWAIATAPQKRRLWPQSALLWEASDPYLYVRATHDGRVICGGEDEDFTDEDRRDALIGEKTERISEKLSRLLPAVDPTAAFAWAGSFGTTATGLPLIGPLPGKPRIHAVLGYGGNGITWSQLAAEIVASAIEGRADSDADLFAFDR